MTSLHLMGCNLSANIVTHEPDLSRTPPHTADIVSSSPHSKSHEHSHLKPEVKAAYSPTKHALLIGVNNYSNTPLRSLYGARNDIGLISEILNNQRFGFSGNVTVLLDEQATHSNIKNSFEALAAKVNQGDFVYIHYSGHGSYTQNLTASETEPYDQTWVSFGSRNSATKGIDHDDILDDELHEWLIPIFAKAAQVVFISDSCHSASVTRGDVVVRAAPSAKETHPLATHSFKSSDLSGGVTIGAAQDDELAGEYTTPKGEKYGLFTWHWGQVLETAKPGETWNDLFKKTQARVTQTRKSQHPQITGQLIDQPVFGDQYKGISQRIAVTDVLGNKGVIRAGLLAGVTPGSIYRLYDPSVQDQSSLATLTIDKINNFLSFGKINGSLKIGDLLVEESHVYTLEPISVFIAADLEKDQGLVRQLKKAFKAGKFPAYKLAKDQGHSQMTWYVFRPRNKNGQPIFAKQTDTLPRSFKEQKIQLWVLTNTEQVWHPSLKIPFEVLSQGFLQLQNKMNTLAKVREVKNLKSGSYPMVELKVVSWQAVNLCDEAHVDCIKNGSRNYYSHPAIFNMAEFTQQIHPENTLLTFIIDNKSDQDYYVYLLNITDDGEIWSVFPQSGQGFEMAKITAGNERDLRHSVAMTTGNAGSKEVLKLIVTKKPIDIALLEQHGLRRGKRSESSPLEALLSMAVTGTRGEPTPIETGSWGAFQYSFLIGDKTL